jgi:tellurite resistance-related uncharacterized protein
MAERSTSGSARPACTTIIAGFHQDPDGEWVADLACGHAQHVRHRPPWQDRPWVQSEAGREAKLGAPIECPLCEMPRVPEGARERRRTASFTEVTVPAGLLQAHRTKAGVWARIVVEAGELEYTLENPRRMFVLTPESAGVAPPEEPHHVRAVGPVRFHVVFLDQPPARAAD